MSPMSRYATAARSAGASRLPTPPPNSPPARSRSARNSCWRARAGGGRFAARSFFNGLYETERADDELLVETRIPAISSGYRSSFMELARRHGDFALAGVCCHARVDGNVLSDVRLAYFGSEDRPRFAGAASAAAEGKAWSEDVKEAVKAALGDDLDPIGNFHASAATRLHLARVLTGRAIDRMVAAS